MIRVRGTGRGRNSLALAARSAWDGAKAGLEVVEHKRREREFLVCNSFPTRLFSTPAASAKIAAQAARPPPGKSQVVQSGAAGGLAQE